MKKLLLSITALLTLSMVNAQNDTLSAHCDVSQLSSGILDFAAPIDSGFVAGTNFYGDLAKMRLFDASHEVTMGGTITGIAFYALTKVDNGGSMQFAIWSDNAGAPTIVPVGFKSVTIASIDTATASTMTLGDGNIYNNIVTFTTPIQIPAGNKFWAGFILPTTTGDLFAVPISVTQDGSNTTHTGEFWSDMTFHTFGDPNNWGLDGTIAIYPIVNFSSGAGLEENNLEVSVYPNPTNSTLNIKTSSAANHISIISMDGKVVAESNLNGLTGAINVAELVNGVYFYEVSSSNGAVIRNTFVKN
ncbi:MAG: T9SS type A sorting domain-containing protein [Crocinitomicaceae bacterium]